MQQVLRSVWLAILALVLCVPSAGPAQQSGTETLSEEALSKLSDLQTAAGQLASQQGQFAGRTIGPQFASATNQLLQVLTNFDVWACGVSVTALHLKRQRLAVAAAGMDPADPALDRAVDDFGRVISQLQELCDRYVHRIYGDPHAGGVTGTTPQPPVEEPPPPPTMSVQERICYDRCHELYDQFIRAEFEYERAVRDAAGARQSASSARQESNRAAERAGKARQQADESQREYDRLQSAMPRASNQSERLRMAEQLSHLHPGTARQSADNAQRRADEAARQARQAEERAAHSEAQANALYDAMMEIYQAWERCARACAEQARTIDRVVIDPRHIFPAMPQSPPRPAPFYRPAPTPTLPVLRPQPSAVRPGPFESRILAIHNIERAAVGAPPLRWNPALEVSATAYAQQLARTGQIAHSPREGRGIERENLQKARTGWSADRMMHDWVSEKRLFRPGIFPAICSGDWSLCGHYTQVIWPTTTDVGCGSARGRGFTWFVCRYSPGGNKDGKPVGKPPARPAASASGRYPMVLEADGGGKVIGGEWTEPGRPGPGAAAPTPQEQAATTPKAALTDDRLEMILETGNDSPIVGGEWNGPDPAKPDNAPPKR